MTRRLRVLTTLIGFMALVLVGVAPVAQSAAGNASDLKGTWIGTYQGFDANGFEKGQEKFVLTKVRGSSASGTYQYRSSPTKKWSKPKFMNLSVYDMETDEGVPTLYISGGDALGVYVGKMIPSEGVMRLAYTSLSQDVLVLTIDVRKK